MNPYRAVIVALCMLVIALPAWSEDVDLAELLGASERIVMMRHAIAPGTGDPAQFQLEDCSTQRNLSSTGVDQATRIGERLRAAGLAHALVLSSQWCRCLDTAHALALGPVTALPALNSFFRTRDRGREQTDALKAWIASADLSKPVVMVTHQVNITALTGIVPASGEMLILQREADGVRVLARLPDPG